MYTQPGSNNMVGSLRAQRAWRRWSGVTLIELLIVVAIIGILAAIAYPAYTSFVLQANRTDAVRVLTLNAQILQRCYSQYFAFNNASCPAVSAVSANGHYNVASAITPTTFTMTATPTGNQTKDTTCASFTLDQTGKQSALDTSNNNQSTTCWGSS